MSDGNHPFRNDLDALEAKRRVLQAELTNEEKAFRHRSELRDQIALIDSVLEGETAALIDRVRVKTSCDEAWDAMEGDLARRHCGRCDRDVYDLEQMTREEIATLFAEHAPEGLPCMRLRRRADGRVVTADCPRPSRSRVVLRVIGAMAVGAALAGAGWYVADRVSCAVQEKIEGATTTGLTTLGP